MEEECDDVGCDGGGSDEVWGEDEDENWKVGGDGWVGVLVESRKRIV